MMNMPRGEEERDVRKDRVGYSGCSQSEMFQLLELNLFMDR